MARIATCVVRIAAICRPRNISLSIAASVLVSAGILLVYIINLIFSQRIIRAMHPHSGWHPACSFTLHALYVLIGLTLAIVITATVQSFYTLRPRTRQIDRDLQLYGSTFLTIISFIPLPTVVVSFCVPRTSALDRFGTGRFRTKVGILLAGSSALCLGAAFRCGALWKRPVPRTEPMPGYYSRACFYIFVFAVEIVVIYLYAVMRVDLRFYIPDGADRRHTYRVDGPSKAGPEAEKL
jgi:hypothetical protein